MAKPRKKARTILKPRREKVEALREVIATVMMTYKGRLHQAIRKKLEEMHIVDFTGAEYQTAIRELEKEELIPTGILS